MYVTTEEYYGELVALANETISNEKFILEQTECDTFYSSRHTNLSVDRIYLFTNTFINDDSDTLIYSYLVDYETVGTGTVVVNICELAGCYVSNPTYDYLCNDSSILILDNPPVQKNRYVSEEKTIAALVGGSVTFWVTFLSLLFIFNQLFT